MPRINVLLTSELNAGMGSFLHDELEVVFHRWSGGAELPLLDGAVWAFVDWEGGGVGGLELCRRLRCNPLTARAHITMVVSSLDGEHDHCRRAMRNGADDCAQGPIDRVHVLDRILAQRFHDDDAGADRITRHGDLTVDSAAAQACWQGRPLNLMPNELRLLRYFLEHPGQVFTRSQIIEALGKDGSVEEQTVNVWIGRLRRELRKAKAGDPLRTVRSFGYVFDPN